MFFLAWTDFDPQNGYNGTYQVPCCKLSKESENPDLGVPILGAKYVPEILGGPPLGWPISCGLAARHITQVLGWPSTASLCDIEMCQLAASTAA